ADLQARLAALRDQAETAQTLLRRRGGFADYPPGAVCPGLSDLQLEPVRQRLSTTIAGGGLSVQKISVTPVQDADLEPIRTVRARRATSGSAAENIRQAMNSPLFGPLGGRGGVADPTIRLQGIARAPGRVAALLAIDAKPSAWLGLGETRDGVTLVEVSGSR